MSPEERDARLLCTVRLLLSDDRGEIQRETAMEFARLRHLDAAEERDGLVVEARELRRLAREQLDLGDAAREKNDRAERARRASEFFNDLAGILAKS